MTIGEKSSHATGASLAFGVDGLPWGGLFKLQRLLNPKKWPSLRILFTGHLLLPIALLGFAILCSLSCVTLLLFHPPRSSYLLIPLLTSVLLAGASLLVLLSRLRSQLLRPLATLEKTVNQVCEGEPVVTQITEQTGVLGGMARNIGSLNAELTDIYEDMEAVSYTHLTLPTTKALWWCGWGGGR